MLACVRVGVLPCSVVAEENAGDWSVWGLQVYSLTDTTDPPTRKSVSIRPFLHFWRWWYTPRIVPMRK
jgi:hypothetical protein